MYLLIFEVRMLLFPSIQLQKKSWHQLNPCHVQRYHSILNILHLILLPMTANNKIHILTCTKWNNWQCFSISAGVFNEVIW